MIENTTDIKSTIVSFIQNNFLMNNISFSFDHDDSLMEKGIVDSTGVLEMVTFLQQEFNIEISDEELVPENLDSVNNVVSYIIRKKSSAS